MSNNLPTRQKLVRLLLGALGASVLALAFAAYLQPSFVFDLANRIVLCF
ncbi:hypothetical protein [Noviherbaspirillum saxi]|nr:hypothetical protein [Noviherbaspirillum saxi]